MIKPGKTYLPFKSTIFIPVGLFLVISFILPSSTIQITPNAYQILYENSYNPGALCFKDIPPYGVFTIRQRRDPSQQIQIDYISTQETDFPCRMNTSITLEEDRMNAASHLLELLEKSIWKRISTYDSITSQPQ